MNAVQIAFIGLIVIGLVFSFVLPFMAMAIIIRNSND